VARGDTFALRCLDADVTLRLDTQRAAYYKIEPSRSLWLQHSPRKSHTIELRAGRTVRARLEDARGAPVIGAEVRLLATRRAQVEGGRIGGKNMTYHQAEVHAMVRSGLDGSVEIRGLDLEPDTDLVLQAVGPGWFTETPFAVVDPIEDLGAIRLRPAASLRGRVLSADGQPAPGARLSIENPVGCWREVFAACDRQGAFLITDVLPGPCRTGIVDQPRSEKIDNAVAGQTIDVPLVR
ncbi:MAG: carboxypeptidase regulatory-like domain-containing protein, partial [Planctomycetes bacterium]|nr:carboxypeptidase regulatory-like domain-containing protein [Planctomycetota bacterium]